MNRIKGFVLGVSPTQAFLRPLTTKKILPILEILLILSFFLTGFT